MVFVASRWMLYIALLVYAYQAGGAVGVALLGVALTLPSVVIVPLVAGLGDRFRRQRVLTAIYGFGAVGALVLALALQARLDLVVVFAVASVVATLAAMVRPVQSALLPSLARSPGELIASNVASSTAEGIGALVGPAVGAALLVVGGQALVAVVAAGGLALAALAMSRIDVAVTERPIDDTGRGAASLLATASQGLKALADLPAPRLVIISFGAQVFVRGMLTVLLVVLAVSTLGLGPPGVGTLNAAIGAGGLVGAVLAMGLVGRSRLSPAFALGLVGWGLPIVVIGLLPSPIVAISMLAVLGVSNAFLDVAGFTLLQGTVPDRVRASVLGVLEGWLGLWVAIGGVAGSIVVERLGVETALIVAGAILPVLAVVLWPRLARLEDQLIVPEARLNLLRGVPMFAPLSLAVLEQLAAGMTEVDVPAGTEIIHEGDVGDAFYVLAEGTTEVIGAGQHRAVLGPGDSFGEIALIRGVPRTATVIATTECRRLPDGQLLLPPGGHRQPIEPVGGGPRHGGPVPVTRAGLPGPSRA